MKIADVHIGQEYLTRIGRNLARVIVVGTEHGVGGRTKFRVERPGTPDAVGRAMLRSAAALRPARATWLTPPARKTLGVPSRPVVSIDPDGVSIVAKSAVAVPAGAIVVPAGRRDNRGGKHGGNQGGRPSNESQGLELRNQRVMLRFTESEYAGLLACAEADPDADGAELAVWLRDTLLDMIGGRQS